MHRLKRVLSQLKDSEGSPEVVSTAVAVQNVRESLTVTTEKLRQIQLYFLADLLNGLGEKPAGVVAHPMLPSYVVKRRTDDLDGHFYALDLGGTNFRVLQLTLEKGKVKQTSQKQFTIPQEHMRGTAKGLFGFIASSVSSVVKPGTTGALGFTFSFPVTLLRINAGKLIQWTKGFTTSGVVDEDVVGLLQKEFDAQGISLKIVALCNDTVGTLITEYFKDNSAAVGVILGTGANACYWEKIGNISKYTKNLPPDQVQAEAKKEIVINMECGSFDSPPRCLPVTQFDQVVDRESPNVGKQIFEKMLSGMYLGEICRQVFVHLRKQGALPMIEGLQAKGKFETWQMSAFLADTSASLSAIEKHLQEKYRFQSTLAQRQLFREICELVAMRSARLASAAITTIIAKMGVDLDATVSIDGSVFEKVPGYKAKMEETIAELYDGQPYNIRLVLTKEGSGVGAGLIAALSA